MYHPNKFVIPFFAVVLLVSLPACGSSGLTSLISTPTPTLEPTPTPEEIYTAGFADVIIRYEVSVAEFREVAMPAIADKRLFRNSNWGEEILDILKTFGSINKDVRKLDPPARFVDVHDHLLNAAEHYDEFVRLFLTSIVEFNTAGADGYEELYQSEEEVLLAHEERGLAITLFSDKLNE